MRELRIATPGRIVSGVDAGRYVQILDDWANSGGFLILTHDGDGDRAAEGHDSWVESIVDVELYFDECGWVVEWDDGPGHQGTDDDVEIRHRTRPPSSQNQRNAEAGWSDVNVDVIAVEPEHGTVRLVCCDRVLSVGWEGAPPEIGPAFVEVDVPDTSWSSLLAHRSDGIPAVVTDYDADGTTQLSLLDGSTLLLVTTGEPPFGVLGTRVTVPSAGWTVYPVRY